MAERPQPERPPRGAEHARLEGAKSHFRYRAQRLSANEIQGALLCEFRLDGREYQGVEVLDLSVTGLALRFAEPQIPGTRLERLRVTLDGAPVLEGEAEVVQLATSGRLGCRFVGRVVDMDVLRFRSDALSGVVLPAVEKLRLTDELPAEWVAGVGQYVRLFSIARHGLDAVQEDHENWQDQRISQELCASMYDVLIPEMEELVRRLAKRSDRFDASAREVALAYSTVVAQDEFGCGEFIGRAYQKPLGYAGDYWMMELLQMDELRGDSLYQRFLHMCSRESAMGRSVRRRGYVAQQRISELVDSGRPVRILSLACGPAVEIRRFLREHPAFENKVEILLVDQDERALRACYEGLNRAVAERGDDPPVELHALHYSLRQIIAPKRGAERELTENVLDGVDLVYSMGMFDYLGQPLARRAAHALYGLLNRGGSLFVGNLMDVPESSWVMEYCMAWTLNYRTSHDMLDLATGIEPMPSQVDVVKGAGECLFLDVRRD